MKYISTRGGDDPHSFTDILLRGLASDGGLFIPEEWPVHSYDGISGDCYSDVAADVLKIFIGDDFSRDFLDSAMRDAYSEFDTTNPAPINCLDRNDYLLELFHGPTLAFKDFAMQALSRLFDKVLDDRNASVTIVAATSGDTGAAAIHALSSSKRIRTVILHPKGRVTDVQRRFMTTVRKPNVLNLAVNGDFDDCQRILKALFADRGFSETTHLSAVNSINWARIAAQATYFITACRQIGGTDLVHFVVPTGNFGDIFAGYVAKKMGAPIGRLIIATNANDILFRAYETGVYSSRTVAKTISPSMDIQVASNFERILFEACYRNAAFVADQMNTFIEQGSIELSSAQHEFIKSSFGAFSCSDQDALTEIEQHYKKYDELIDPHTAVARVARNRFVKNEKLSGPVVTVSTAHPAKFPGAVEDATGVFPALPAALSNLMADPEEFNEVPAAVSHVKDAILAAWSYA